MSRRISRRALLLVLPLAGCALAGPPRADPPPEVSIVALRPVQIGLLEQALELELRFVNLSPVPLDVDGLRYELGLDGGHLGRGASDARFTLPRLGAAVVPVRLYVQTADLIGRIGALPGRERLGYELSGELFTAGGAVAFTRAGAIELPRLPPSS